MSKVKPQTRVDGTAACHRMVSDACRTAHGDIGAARIVISAAEKMLMDSMKAYPNGKGAVWHVVLTMEVPER